MNWLLIFLIAVGLASLAYAVFFLEPEGADKSGALFGDVFLAKKTANGNGLGAALDDPSGAAEA